MRLESDFIQATCTPEFSFDESALFIGDKADLKDKFQNAFRNIVSVFFLNNHQSKRQRHIRIINLG